MKKLLTIILVLLLLAILGYGIYYFIDISSFNVMDDTVVISTQESYQIDVYNNNGDYNEPKLYKYITSDDKVAYVDENGRIISVGKGDCDITIKRGYKKHVIKVTVYEKDIPPTPEESNSNTNSNSSSNSNSNSNTNIPVTGIKLVTENSTIKVGQTLTINYVITPENATNKSVTYSVDNNDVISINNGIVTGKKEGKATVLIKTVDGNYSAKYNITVSKDTVSVTGISATISSNTITVGSTAKITTKITPTNASNKSVSYKSNNTAVATVDHNGTVKGLSAGTATITVTSNDGHKTATVKVTVNNPIHASSVTVTGPSEVIVNKTITLHFNPTPSNAIENKATWTSTNTEVAVVNSNGVVTGKKPGTTIIYATLANGVRGGMTVVVKGETPVYRVFFTAIKNNGSIISWQYHLTRNNTVSTDYMSAKCGTAILRPTMNSVPGNINRVTTCTVNYRDDSGTTSSTTAPTIWSE